jgi:hypothetical protein
MKEGHAAEACPKLEEAQRLDAGMATQFRLAECYEKVGKLASAWASFIAVADSAAVAKMPEREAAARKRAEAVAPRIARLTLTVPPAVAALQGIDVQRDGSPVARPLWGVPVPVDPGEHVVIVVAPGKKPWQGRVTAGDTGGVIALSVPPLEDLPRDAPLPPPPAPARPAVGRSAGVAIALGTVAIAAAATGGAFFAVHQSRTTEAQATSFQIKQVGGTCAGAAPDARCGALAGAASSSDTFGNASTVAFVGAGAAATALALYLIWPRETAPAAAKSVHLAPAVGKGLGGVFATGSF